MAFTYTVEKVITGLNGRKVIGKYTNTSGSTGGDIYTGLSNIYSMLIQPEAVTISANRSVVNETMPLATDGVTIVTSADEVGIWEACGE